MELDMGKCIEKLPCGDCGSSDSIQVFYNEENDTYSSYCFSKCLEAKGDPYSGDKPKPKLTTKTPEQIQQEIQDIRACKVMNQDHRGLPAYTFSQWGVRLLVSEYNGTTPYALGFGYTNDRKLTGWKCKTINKKAFWTVGDTKSADMFGLERALKVGGKRIFITEGELDAIALEYALKSNHIGTSYASRNYAVVSIPHGTGSLAKAVKKSWPKIKGKFEEYVFIMDEDDAGIKALKEAQQLVPSMMTVTLPSGCNDPLEVVEKGRVNELVKNCLWNAHKPPIKGVVRVSEVMERVLEVPTKGLSYPTPLLDDMTYGQRFAECVAVGAGVGLGKTVLAHCWGAHNMMHHKIPCNMILLEEQNHATVRNIAGKVDGITYHIPDTKYDEDQFIATCTSLQEMLFMWESDGDQDLRFDISEIINGIRFNTMEYGCRFHYLDNMTRLVDHLSPSQANEFINKYASELENLSVQLDIHIDVFSHLNNTGTVDHERGGEVWCSQFTGSRGMMRSFPMMMGFRRNKYADGRAKNNSIVQVLKNRKYGGEGSIKTSYNPDTGRIRETEWEGELYNASEQGGH